MGLLHYFLGIKFIQDEKNGTIWLGQSNFTEEILQEFNMKESKASKTPVNRSEKLVKGTVLMSIKQSAVENYSLFTRTRPDI